ncbi:hypothetical protein GCM10009863_49210 [Streptomyces axinellae]|uniref:Uncharacterized protein n=1 Tax=Streptomyces axinellae TaxID=552788 RepID=A0ABP6CWM4_9ACTN
MDQTPSVVPSETGIARLYGLSGEAGYPALVELGTFPTARRNGAQDWEANARQRMHNLLNSKSVASKPEKKVLRKANIPLRSRGEGRGFHINPSVERESDNARAESAVDSARGIARLYGLSGEAGYPALVQLGTHPAGRRNGAQDWESQARRRLRDLLLSRNVASPPEEEVLRKANIPLRSRGEGRGFHINPGVERESDNARAESAVDSAMDIARLYGLSGEAGYPALVQPGTLPKTSRNGAPAWENQARRRLNCLLNPAYKATPAEVAVMEQARIRLTPREKGEGQHIHPNMKPKRGRGPTVAASVGAWNGAAVARMTPGGNAGALATDGPQTTPAWTPAAPGPQTTPAWPTDAPGPQTAPAWPTDAWTPDADGPQTAPAWTPDAWTPAAWTPDAWPTAAWTPAADGPQTTPAWPTDAWTPAADGPQTTPAWTPAAAGPRTTPAWPTDAWTPAADGPQTTPAWTPAAAGPRTTPAWTPAAWTPAPPGPQTTPAWTPAADRPESAAKRRKR